jgi:hypothetical protein
MLRTTDWERVWQPTIWWVGWSEAVTVQLV